MFSGSDLINVMSVIIDAALPCLRLTMSAHGRARSCALLALRLSTELVELHGCPTSEPYPQT